MARLAGFLRHRLKALLGDVRLGEGRKEARWPNFAKASFRPLDDPNWLQKSRPRVPVPSLAASLSRYVDYASVVASGPQLELTKAIVKDFGDKDGPKLQDQLLELAEKDANWVNRFWLPEMYLANRFCLPAYSNPAYIFPRQKFNSCEDHIRYAACLVRGLCTFKELCDKRAVPQELSTGKEKVEMCMEQYWRVFTSHRLAQH